MEKVPSISVIVPVYNVEKYVKFCIDSILTQSFQDFEIILVDDASPDNSVELCRKFYSDNHKVRFIRHEKNLGLGPARNTGIKNARGKYVCFVDSDDFILPDTLEKFYNAAEKNNAEVVHAAGYYELSQDEVEPILQENLRLIWDRHNQEGFLNFNVPYRLEYNWKENYTRVMAWLCFCKRDFLLENKLEFLPILSEDEPFCFALLSTAERYYILYEALYIYRNRTGSIMISNNIERLSKGISSLILATIYLEKFFDFLPRFENYDLWRENILNELFSRFLRNHIFPYYKDSGKSSERNSIVTKALIPFFGEKAPFVKFFFDGFHSYHHQTELLLMQNQQLEGLLTFFINEQPHLLQLMTSIRTADKRIFLMGTPTHGNIGDQAIVMGELSILKNYFPDHEVIEIPYEYLTGTLGDIFWRLGFEEILRDNGIIFMHGGGNLGNLWLNEEELRRKLIEKFPTSKIVIFPQSICFTDDDAGRNELSNSQKVYNAHKDLHLMTRDENSFSLAKKIFPKIHTYLLPDAATVLHGILDNVEVKREGVLFILRSDKEKVRDDAKIQMLVTSFNEANIPFEVIDTVINEKVTALNREQKIRDVLVKIRKSKLVITDRFHGVIFSFITRTPVLAFKSFDTKISSGIKWFKNLKSIFYAEEKNLIGIEDFINRAFKSDTPFEEMNTANKTNGQAFFFNTLSQITNS
jgi:pyruvyl transferase EpsI